MEKDSYETYEYPPANEPESESDHFFIVQDNGTFIIDTNRQVQYVAQVQNGKSTLEPSQPCTVYDVTHNTQQFLVGVDNASELTTVSEQYVSNTQSNLFPSTYLLQPSSTTMPEPVQQHVTENEDGAGEINKQMGACTEITLSDEQYQLLEQKGWLLLEMGDKIYVLNMLGLHDITTNGKLIEKLKNESQSNTSQDINIGTCNLENDAPNIFQTDYKYFSSMSEQIGESEKTNEESDSTVNQDSIDDSSDVQIEFKDEEQPGLFGETTAINKDCPEVTNQQDTEMNTRVLVIENENIRRVGNTLKIKTKLSLKDFPEKIHLGKTRNGRRLVAKRVKTNTDADVNKSLEMDKDKPNENASMVSLSALFNIDTSMILSAESEFHLLVQHLFRNVTNKPQCSGEDIVTARSVIAQLVQIPAFKPSVIGHDLIITKVLQKIDSSGTILSKMLSAVVTGRVSQVLGQWHFIHLPNMLQKIVNDTVHVSEELVSKEKNGGYSFGQKSKNVLHVQIAEAKEVGTDIIRTSVTVNKRKIPSQLIMQRNHHHHQNKKYACSACATVFGTELELKDHQADHSLEAEDNNMLTIDIGHYTQKKELCVIETTEGKTYNCMQCDAKFNRLSSCKSHLNTHYPKNQENEDAKTIYKCNMCTCTYFHPSTLSKHILSRHINKISLLPPT